jgi:hypothetical protein
MRAKISKLTPSQRRVLEFAARHPFGRVVGGDLRIRTLLSDLGLIEPDGYLRLMHLYKITDAGRRVAAKAKP